MSIPIESYYSPYTNW